MDTRAIPYGNSETIFYFDGNSNDLKALIGHRRAIFLTDEQVVACHPKVTEGFPTICVPSGEGSKSFEKVKEVIDKLMSLDVDRKALLIGLGGGVVCDLAGFVAGIYKRGIDCAFIPTSVLAMVDAAVGGKNGINAGAYKNMIGLIRQPEFIFYDYSLLQSLPEEEWINGFAEIIKHACIADKGMFEKLSRHTLQDFRENMDLVAALIRDNALLKASIVQQDENESNLRKKLNFGHTLGHAIERLCHLKHGFAVAVGMAFAAEISEKEWGFADKQRVEAILKQYGLPSKMDYDARPVLELMQADKKRTGETIDFVLLKNLGNAVIHSFRFSEIKNYLSL